MAVQVREIRNGLFVVETRVEDFDVRSAVVVGAERAVVWDTLAHPSHMGPLHGLVGGRPVTVVYSHADWDHVWGTAGLDAAGGILEVIAHEAATRRFITDVPETLAAKQAADPEAQDVRLIAPTCTFTGVLDLDLGGVTLRLRHLPGHTPDCIVGEIPAWGVLLAGDTVETPLPVVNDASALGDWIEGLERCLGGRFELVVPAHGMLGDDGLVRRTASYLRGLCNGNVEPPPGALDSFYADTHRRNVKLVLEPAKNCGSLTHHTEEQPAE